MTEIRETSLPGVGVCRDFSTGAGARLGVVERASGRRELVVYDRDDPDTVTTAVDLAPVEAAALADLLDDRTVARSEGTIEGLIEGLALDWLPVPSGFSPSSIGDLAIRRRTGATVVAVVGATGGRPAPGPDEVLAAGDTVVVVGTAEGITQVAELLRV
jgi:TrkA domain protein